MAARCPVTIARFRVGPCWCGLCEGPHLGVAERLRGVLEAPPQKRRLPELSAPVAVRTRGESPDNELSKQNLAGERHNSDEGCTSKASPRRYPIPPTLTPVCQRPVPQPHSHAQALSIKGTTPPSGPSLTAACLGLLSWVSPQACSPSSPWCAVTSHPSASTGLAWRFINNPSVRPAADRSMPGPTVLGQSPGLQPIFTVVCCDQPPLPFCPG
ncbi:uncharacterized protein LOC132386112 [Hypanus sabinus]|uniref:uncharacterized protein LOC132386112 n=1 Tax=Hypanus sabinus TaxID=79690 RepID=UPI0028C4C994|nr:uncharacterized protein LOC132386112 [Hypanus sabinus]